MTKRINPGTRATHGIKPPTTQPRPPKPQTRNGGGKKMLRNLSIDVSVKVDEERLQKAIKAFEHEISECFTIKIGKEDDNEELIRPEVSD